MNQTRAEAAEQAAADLQQRFDAQARELAEARARIAELERLLAESRRDHASDAEPQKGAQPEEAEAVPSQPQGEQQSGTDGSGAQQPDGHPGNASGGAGDSAARPQPASPRPGIMEVRRQLRQTLTANAELRALIEELQLCISTLERRCAELERQLQRALSLAEGHEAQISDEPLDGDTAARVQERAAILSAELELVRRERTEVAAQRDRLLTKLASSGLASNGAPAGPASDYSAARTELFLKIRSELEMRDRFAQWEGAHRPRETDRRLDPTRTLDEQALVATLTVRWQLMDHAPQTLRHRPRWVIEGVLLDPVSEQFLIRQSRERVAYRQRVMAVSAAGVT